MKEDTKETFGVDSYGDLIPFELYSKRFSQMQNVLSIFFLDCSRERYEPKAGDDTPPERKRPLEVFKDPKGICIVKYGCERGKRKHAVEHPNLSQET